MNLITGKNPNSMSYWCSWHTQNIVAMKDCSEKFRADVASAMKQGADGAKSARMMLNEELVFGKDGYAHQHAAVRSDMYFMLDYGWDVDYGIIPDKNAECYGSLRALSPMSQLLSIRTVHQHSGITESLGRKLALSRCTSMV